MKKRPIILVVVTLIIGFLLGMLTSGQLRNHRLKPVKAFYSEGKFRESMYQAIQPTEEQKEIIDQILDKYSKLNSDATASFRRDFGARMQKFRTEIDSNLTSVQIERLKELDARRMEMIKSRRNNHGREYPDRENRRNDSSEFSPENNPPSQPPLPADRDKV